MKMKTNKVRADQMVYVLRNTYRPSVGITYDVRHNSEFTPGGASIIAVLAVTGSTVTIVSRIESEQTLRGLTADITKATSNHPTETNWLDDYLADQTGKAMVLSPESVKESAQLVIAHDAQVISACVKAIGSGTELHSVTASLAINPMAYLRYDEVTLNESAIIAARHHINKRSAGLLVARRMQRDLYSLDA